MQRELETIESTARTTPSPGGPVRARAKRALRLDLLERIIVAPDPRQTAEAALTAFREVVPGEHFSAIWFNAATRRSEVFFLDHGWLQTGSGFWQAAQQTLCEHPLARKFLAQRKAMALVRSQEVPDAAWRQSAIYHEVDRPLGVADIATIYQPTASDQALVLTCGRSGRFFDDDLAAITSYQRVLDAVVPGCAGVAKANAPVAGPPGSGSLGAPLTDREREILGWLRQAKSNGEISAILGISHHTVRHHLEKIYVKLGVETRMADAHIPGV